MSATHRLRHRHIVSGLVYGLNIRVSYRSNRSAALLKLNKVAKALADADAAIARDPQWDKGFFRKAAALEAQDKVSEVRYAQHRSKLWLPQARRGDQIRNCCVKTLQRVIPVAYSYFFPAFCWLVPHSHVGAT